MQIVLAQVTNVDKNRQLVDVMDFTTGNVYKGISLDSEVNFQQLPKRGSIVALLLDKISASTGQRILKIWGTGKKFRRQLEPNEVQIQAGDEDVIDSGAYLFLDKFGNVELSDGSFRNMIQIDQETASIITKSSNFYFTNFSNSEIYGDEDGNIVIQNTSNGSKIELSRTGKITIVAGTDIDIEGNRINLGFGAEEMNVLGNKLMQLFNNHVHTSPVGPTGVPTIPMTEEEHLSSKVRVK